MHRFVNHAFRTGIAGVLLSLAAAAGAAPHLISPAVLANGEEQAFEGRTEYTLVPAARSGADHAALRAECDDATASGRWLEQDVPLDRAPVLEWRWRVDRIYPGLDERSRSGDDYPARVYVVARRWPAFRSRAINYVWSSSEPIGASWPNAFSDTFAMVAVQSGEDRLGEWVTQRRNVREDFRRLHGLEAERVDVLAIMTDCDNAGETTTAFYGPIRWRPAGPVD